MKKRTIFTAVLCGFFIATVLSLNCDQTEKGQIPVTTSSKEALNLYREGMVQMDQVQFEKARALFEKAIEKDSTFAKAHFELAYISFEPQNYLMHLSKALSFAGHVSEGEKLLIQSQIEFSNGNNNKGEELLRKLIALYPQDREAHLALATYLDGLQRYEEAAGEYQKVVTEDPSYAMGYNMMAYGYMYAGKMNEAEKAIQKYIELRPAEPNPYDTQGDVLRKSGKFDESTASFRKALAMDSTFISSHRGIGINLAMQGRMGEAIAEIDAAFKKAPDDGQRRSTLYAKAFAWALTQDFQNAMDIFKKCLEMDEKNKDTMAQSNDLSYIAWILLEHYQFEKSQETSIQALKLAEASNASEEMKDTMREQFVFSESDLARRQGRLKMAVAKAEEFHKTVTAKNDPFGKMQYQDLIGSLALAEKRYDDAIRELEKGNPRNCYILYRMGEAYAAKGDKVKAKEMFSKVANFNEYNWGFAFLRAGALKKLKTL